MTRQEAFTLLGVYILGMVWIILNNIYDISLVLCPTKILFGIPCPGCGMTRAMKLCVEGNFVTAIQMNPNILIALIAIPCAPIFLTVKILANKDYINKINKFLCNKYFLIFFAVIESMIWINNIIRNI